MDLKINKLFHNKGHLFSKHDYYIYSSIVTIYKYLNAQIIVP